MPQRPVVLFTNALHPGGTAVMMGHLAEAMRQQGVPVEVLLVRREGRYVEVFEQKNIPLASLEAKSRNALPVLALRRYLKARNPAVLIAMGGFRNAIAVAAGLLAKTDARIIVSEHGITSFAALSAQRNLLVKWTILCAYRLSAMCLYRYADRCIAISQAVARQLEGFAGLKRGSVEVIYNPVDEPYIAERAKAPAPHPWLHKKEIPVVMAAGRLHPVKDFATLIRAFHHVRQRMACRLLILGEGMERESLQRLIHSLGLADDVHLTGFTDNPYAYMSRADVFVVSSRSEALSTVLIEAMACGCPLVATDGAGGVREVLEQGRYGRLVPVGESELLAEAIAKTLSGDSVATLDALKERARYFSVERSMQAYLRLLK